MPISRHQAIQPALLRIFLLALATFAAAVPLHASDWTAPAPDELKMTTDPAAPDAPAVYLYREEISDDKLHLHSLYVRIKVLTEKGKSWADVEIPFNGRAFSVTDVAARTIHPDGTVIPLTGKPLEKMLMRQGKERFESTVFSLPAVEPGSILEYRYKLRYDDERVVSPEWYIQQPIYLHKAHYSFTPFDLSSYNHFVTGAHGDTALGLTYSGRLPPDAKIAEVRGVWNLDVNNVPPLPHESYMPPMQSTSYRLMFYYATTRNTDEFWAKEGKYWSKEVDRFANPSPAMHAAVTSLTTPADTPEIKLRKIYAAIMGLENTSFTREHTEAENKAAGLKVKTADDIWTQKRGNADELDRLFIALARAAGFKAYDMIVVDRNRDILMKNYMEWRQLNDEIAIVNLNGTETWFDPGQRYAEFGKLDWKHTSTGGVRQTDGGTALADSIGLGYKDVQLARTAELKMDDHGAVTGTVRILMSGAPALHWRQRALELDDEALRRDYEHSVRDEFPSSVEVKLDHFIGLKDPDHLLMAILKVEGSLGSQAGHRVLLPASFFNSTATRLFPQQTRETPVDLRYPLTRKDTVTLTLPADLKIESLPKDSDLSLPKCAIYSTKYAQKDNTYTYTRTFVLAVALFMPQEYSGLRDFYEKMGAKDEEQAVLIMAPTSGGTASNPGITQ